MTYPYKDPPTVKKHVHNWVRVSAPDPYVARACECGVKQHTSSRRIELLPESVWHLACVNDCPGACTCWTNGSAPKSEEDDDDYWARLLKATSGPVAWYPGYMPGTP